MDPSLMTLLDEVEYEAVYNLEIDGTQPHGMEGLLNEEDILPPPLHFRKTSSSLEVRSDLPIYPAVPDWHHGPTNPITVPINECQDVDVSLENEEARFIKMGAQLTREEVAKYKELVLEFRDIFAWSYKDLKGIPPEIVQHTIPLLPNVQPVRQKERRMNPRLQLIVKAELEKLLEAGFIKPVEITDWDAKLNAALWAYRTTFKVTTKQTPFALVYGVEAILPIEIEIPSLRIAINNRWPVSKSIHDRVLMLEGLNETRRFSAQHIETAQRRKKAAFDKSHKKRTLLPGTMVMLQDGKKLEFPGKFDAIWLGPYWIMEVYPNNTVQLATLDGTYFPMRTNGERCKTYHV